MQSNDYLKLSERTEKKFPGGMNLDGEQTEALFITLLASVRTSFLMDQIKRNLIYGKPLNEEVIMKAVTFPESPSFNDGHSIDSFHSELLHHGMGAITEAGEILEVVAAAIFDKKPIDKDNLREEIGDALWYLAGLCRLADTTLDAEMARNIAKLTKRYPDKYTDEAAINRDLDAERAVIEAPHHPV